MVRRRGRPPEDAWKDGQIIRARCAPLSPAPQAASATSGFSVSRSEQVIHEISGLGLGYAVGGQGLRHSLSFDLDSGSSFGQSLYNLAPSLT